MGLTPRGAKRKGDEYERELASYLNNHLFGGKDVVFRAPLSGGGRQFTGGGGSSDLVGTPDVWVEAKRTERFQPYEAMAQAERGVAGKRCLDFPVVVTRRSRMATEESLVVMRMADWLELYRAFLESRGTQTAPADAGPSAPNFSSLKEIAA